MAMVPAIDVNALSKRYRKGRGLSTLRERLSGRHRAEGDSYHWAVRDVSFAVAPGESLGIIGPNGAGKTTILKLLSRVTEPTSGTVSVRGRFSSLIELGAGFHPDLTGRENIYLNGTILGMRREEIRRRFDAIIDFAGIGDYLDTPVKRYSSGMYARLGFAVAAHVEPDVLLVDEVLAVGDYAFQQKCYAQMDALRAGGTSLIFVSHNFEAVRRVCERGLVMYRGRDAYQGSAAEAIVAYSETLRRAARETAGDRPAEEGLAQRYMSFEAEIEAVRLLDAGDQPVNVIASGDTVRVAVDVCFHETVRQPVFSLTVRTPDGGLVYDTTTHWQGIATPDFAAGERRRVLFELSMSLLGGEYVLGVDTLAADLSHYYDRMEQALTFVVRPTPGAKGTTDLGGSFLLVEPEPGP
jgi:ABC-type polysaccharide/polyol phosphate transport system ATPase subunit